MFLIMEIKDAFNKEVHRMHSAPGSASARSVNQKSNLRLRPRYSVPSKTFSVLEGSDKTSSYGIANGDSNFLRRRTLGFIELREELEMMQEVLKDRKKSADEGLKTIPEAPTADEILNCA